MTDHQPTIGTPKPIGPGAFFTLAEDPTSADLLPPTSPITAVDQLAELPAGAILRDSRGEPVWRSERWGWRAGNGVRDIEPELLIEDGGPLELLYPRVEVRDV